MPVSAVAEAGDVADEDLIRPEQVAIGATLWPTGHPPAVRGLYQVAQHIIEPSSPFLEEMGCGMTTFVTSDLRRLPTNAHH